MGRFVRGLLPVLGLAIIFWGAWQLSSPSNATADAYCSGKSNYIVQTPQLCGFYSNNYDPYGGSVLSSGLNVSTSSGLINTITGDIGDARDGAGASFIIDTMLGNGPSGGMITSTSDARVTNWKNLVNTYASKGLIKYSYSYYLACNTPNTYKQNNFNDIGVYEETSSSSSSTPCGSSYSTVAFMDPTNTNTPIYVIKRNCGNPLGDMTPLPEPSKPPTGNLTLSCNSGGAAHATYSDSDGATNAYVTVTIIGQSSPSYTSYKVWNNGASYPPTWVGGVRKYAIDNRVHVVLYVQDIGASGKPYRAVDSGNLGACTPKGSFVSVVCSNAGQSWGTAYINSDGNQYPYVRIYISDPNSTTQSANYQSYQANQQEYQPDGSVWYGHSHRFNFYPTDFGANYNPYNSYTFYEYAVWYDSSGSQKLYPIPVYNTTSTYGITLGACKTPVSPTGSVSISCTDVHGNATDADYSGHALQIRIYLDSTSNPPQTISTDSSGNFGPFNPESGFSSSFPSFRSHTIYVYATGIDYNGNADGLDAQLTGSPQAIYCPPAVSCTSVTPAIAEAGSPATITAVFNYTSADAPSYPTYAINISVSPTGGSGSGISSATNNTASYTYTTPNLPAGTYTASATFSGPSGFTTVSCLPAPFIAYNMPYYKVYGNDVKAGGAFDTGNCSNSTGNTIGSIGFLGGFMPSPDGFGIKGFDNTSNTGAGAQFAAYAIGHIASFNSAMMRAAVGGNPGPTKGLSFANSGGTYGGDVGGTNCIHNYYNDISQLGSSSALGASADPATLNGSYTRTGDLTLNSSAVVPKGSRTIIYVTGGNVYIGAGNGGIKYDTSTWGSLADIPSLWVVVNGGNIFIDPGVTQLDGVYVAQPTTANTKGKIFTCANNGFGAPSLSSINGTAGDACNNQLTVNGALIAQEVELLRSFSSLRYSQAGENPYGSGSNCAGKPTCAAEVFNFGPEVFMAPPNGLGNSGGSKYDYITELPPVL